MFFWLCDLVNDTYVFRSVVHVVGDGGNSTDGDNRDRGVLLVDAIKTTHEALTDPRKPATMNSLKLESCLIFSNTNGKGKIMQGSP